jgi:hypothetical protein
LEGEGRADATKVLEIDLSFSRHKLFTALMDNLPAMFPNDKLITKVKKSEL